MGHIKPDLIDVDLIRGELENWFFYTYYVFSLFFFPLPTWQNKSYLRRNLNWGITPLSDWLVDMSLGIFWLLIDVGVPAHLRDATPGQVVLGI